MPDESYEYPKSIKFAPASSNSQIRQGEVLCYIGVRDARGEGGGRHRGEGQ
jgi:hypothetical protein